MAASMSTGVATLAAVPAAAGLRTQSVEGSLRSSVALLGQAKGATCSVAARRPAVGARASASEQESQQVWNVAKSAAVAAALSLVISASPVEAKEGSGFLKFPDNSAGEASRQILGGAKKKADESFAEAQRTGKETTGQAASAGDAPPAISQVDPNADEAADSVGDAIAAKADAAANLAPGTGQQNGKKGVNPIEKAFATPTRGLGDKAGENQAKLSDLMGKKNTELPGDDQTYRQNTELSEGIYNTFKSAGEGRDAGVGIKPQ